MSIRKVSTVRQIFEVGDDGIIEYIHNITIMAFPDDVIRVNKHTEKIVPLRNKVCGPIEPTVPQLKSWAVSDNCASEASICMRQMTFGHSRAGPASGSRYLPTNDLAS
jgi:hypothetical protein